MKKWMLFCSALCSLAACHTPSRTEEKELRVSHTVTPPQIDGNATDSCWSSAAIHPIDQLWAGKLPHASDFMGRYRICWDSSYLYLLAEIYDDSLVTHSPGAADRYWDRDGLDLFIKEEPSPSNGDSSTRSFHITFDSLHAAVPLLIGGSEKVKIAVTHQEHLSTWEIALSVHATSRPSETLSRHWELAPGKSWGFSIAYNDNDKSKERESRMGNRPIEPGLSKTQGGHNPGVYQQIRLDEGN
jgi:hypothetical protein